MALLPPLRRCHLAPPQQTPHLSVGWESHGCEEHGMGGDM